MSVSCVHVGTSASRSQERMSDPLHLKSQAVVKSYVVARTELWSSESPPQLQKMHIQVSTMVVS